MSIAKKVRTMKSFAERFHFLRIVGQRLSLNDLLKLQVVFFSCYLNKYRSNLKVIMILYVEIHGIIARIGPIYGEMDRCSIICDMILAYSKLPSLPFIGDRGGVIQV